jgi:hypothetical protein
MEKITAGQITIFKFIFSRIFPLPFIIVGALLLYFGIKGLLIAIESVNWPHTNAIVISSSIKSYSSSSARGRTQHQAEIHYEFFVQKSRYGGYHQIESPNAEEPVSWVNRYPKGKQITVYYMPDNPAESLLEPGLKLKTLIMPAGGLIFFVPGMLMAIFLPRLMKKVGQTTEQGSPQDVV